MKKFVLCLIVLCMPALAFGGTWCQWSGTEGENCKSTSRTYIVIEDHKVTISAENLNPRGWYERTVTQPTIGEDQVKDAEVWSFADNEIGLTWTVRDMTATEIDKRDAGAMSLSNYYQWKVMLHPTIGIVTLAQLEAQMPAEVYQELVRAYQARGRLENP